MRRSKLTKKTKKSSKMRNKYTKRKRSIQKNYLRKGGDGNVDNETPNNEFKNPMNWDIPKISRNSIYIHIGAMGCQFSLSERSRYGKTGFDVEGNFIFVCDTTSLGMGVTIGKATSLVTGCRGSGIPELSDFYKSLQFMIQEYLNMNKYVFLYGHSYGGGISNQISETPFTYRDNKNKKLYVRTVGSIYITRNPNIPQDNLINLVDVDDWGLGANESCYDINNVIQVENKNKNVDHHNDIFHFRNLMRDRDRAWFRKPNTSNEMKHWLIKKAKEHEKIKDYQLVEN